MGRMVVRYLISSESWRCSLKRPNCSPHLWVFWGTNPPISLSLWVHLSDRCLGTPPFGCTLSDLKHLCVIHQQSFSVKLFICAVISNRIARLYIPRESFVRHTAACRWFLLVFRLTFSLSSRICERENTFDDPVWWSSASNSTVMDHMFGVQSRMSAYPIC